MTIIRFACLAEVPLSILVRHQAASIAATVLDFGAMTLLVEHAGVAPHVATLFGAGLGACLNFTLNRRHVFEGAAAGSGRVQATRYAAVSAASALLNSVGEYVGTRLLGAPYLGVRAVTAVAVSLGWNFPMHRGFVFRDAEVSG